MKTTSVSCLSKLRSGMTAGLAAIGLAVSGSALADSGPVKVGLMLPYTGTFAQLGEAITNGIQMAIEEHGGHLGGRDVEIVTVDDESDPSRATQNAQRLISGERVDFLIGTVHSGVATAMVRVAREEGVPTIIPNAGFDAATGALCAPNIFRTSFSSWQTAYPMGKAAYERGYERMVTLAWRYAFGQESVAGFKQGFEEAGGEIIREIYVPFPDVEFQAQLAEIASLRPDAVFSFFAGGGAVQYVRDYAAAGLNETIPLTGSGFLTDGTLHAQGEAAEGVLTTLNYSTQLDNEHNQRFVQAYEEKFDMAADIYAVQGYDTGILLVRAMEAVNGKTSDRDALLQAMREVEFPDSPRGPWQFSRAQHPIQNIYLREVQNGQNVVVDIAAEALEDPARGCNM